MGDTEKAWRFCAVGNIVKEHSDGENVFYGTKAFTGGTKVYINDRSGRLSGGDITVIGLNRFKRYVLERVPVELVENIRFQRVYKPTVLEIIDYLENMEGDCWRGRTADDRRALEEFVTGRRDMYSYTISKEADEKQFHRACSIVEVQLAEYKKEKLLEDVDGTQIQIYITNGKKIKVVNDYEVDAVFIDTEILLNGIEEYRIK